VYVLSLDPTGVVKSVLAKISSGTNGGPTLANSDYFGMAVAWLGPSATPATFSADVVVGAAQDDTGGTDRGAVYVASLATDGKMTVSYKVASGTNGGPTLANSDQFGSTIAAMGSWGDGQSRTIAVFARDDTGSTDRGGVYILSLGASSATVLWKLASGTNGMSSLTGGDLFGYGLAWLGDATGSAQSSVLLAAPSRTTRAARAAEPCTSSSCSPRRTRRRRACSASRRPWPPPRR
jgi:hypothetical protein